MAENVTKKIGICFICILLVFSCISSFLWAQSNKNVLVEKQKADVLLNGYSETIQLNLNYGSNLITQLEQVLNLGDYATAAVEPVAEELLARKACDTITILEGRNVSGFYGNQTNTAAMVGKPIENLNYAHSLAILVKQFIVEGPVHDPVLDKDIFLLIKPIYRQGEYWGEIATAIDAVKIISSFELATLQQMGYAYELWRVEPNSGTRQTISTSNPDVNFSDSLETKFVMPAIWTLSLKPQNGWIDKESLYTGIFLALIVSLLFGFALWHLLCQRDLRKKLRAQRHIDAETGLSDREGMLIQVDAQIEKAPSSPLFLMYACLKNYGRVASRLTDTKRQVYLQTVMGTIGSYINGNHEIFRTSEDSFSILLYDEYEPTELLHMEKGLAVELLQKVTIAGHELFLEAGCGTAAYPQNCTTAEGLLLFAAENYDKQFPSIVPLYNLTEKCNELLEDDKQVIFENYPDEQVDALAKSIYKYYQKTQRMIYSDNDFDVGNRLGYQRDMYGLISYDRQRNLNLFLLDICDFAKYNKLFSIHTGDDILRHVILQLTGIFGKHLFRINGDVFLGISLNKQTIAETLSRIEADLHDSFQVESHTMHLQYKIGVCEYPCHGGDASALLENLQVALREAKKDENICYKIYTDDTL